LNLFWKLRYRHAKLAADGHGGAVTENLDHLLERIRTEGLEKAQAEAEAVLAASRDEAAQIVAKARQEAEAIEAKATTRAAQLEESGKTALAQAARDLLLTVRGRVEGVFASLAEKSVGKALDQDTMRNAVITLVRALAEKGHKAEVALPAELKEPLSQALLAELGQELSKGLTIITDEELDAGFSVRVDDSGMALDLSDTALAAALARFVRPELAAIVAAAADDTKTA
jgi:V/A-type H+-transporting ATPase subunit E